jgi:arsenate reductase
MAEGWTRHLEGGTLDAQSAGVSPHGVDPRAVRAMREAGVDISMQTSKHISNFDAGEFDYVVTLCDHAHDTCPVFPAKTRVLHAGFPDPPRLAAEAKSEEDAMAAYRMVRDAIREFVERLPEALNTPEE